MNPYREILYAVEKYGQAPTQIIDADPASPTYGHVLGTTPAGPVGALGTEARCAVNNRTGAIYVPGLRELEHDGGWLQKMVTLARLDGRPDSPTFHQILAEWRPETAWGWPSAAAQDAQIALDVHEVRNTVFVSLAEYWSRHEIRLVVLDGDSLVPLSSVPVPAWPDSPSFGNQGGHIASVSVNPATDRFYMETYEQPPIVGIDRPEAAPVAVGSGTTVEPVTVTVPQASVTFADVVDSGTVTIATRDAQDLVAGEPGMFSIEGALAFEITTTANVVAPITLCFNASHIRDPATFASLRVYHGEGGTFVDRTSSSDFATGTICATTSSLSPFIIAQAIEPQYGVVTLYDAARRVNAGSTVPIRIQITDASGQNLSASSLLVEAAGLVHTSTTATAAVRSTGNANADGVFRFDPRLGGTGAYIFNLKTAGMVPGAYEFRFTVAGGARQYSVPIHIR